MAKKSWQNFSETTRACKSALLVAAFFSFFMNMLQLTVPVYMMQILDRVLASGSHETLGVLTMLAILALITMAGLEIIRSRIMVRAGSWFERRMAFDTLLQTTARASRAKSYTTEAFNDLNKIRATLSSNSLNALFDSPWVPVYLLVIFLLHPVMGLIATAGAVMLFALALMNQLATRKPLQQTAGLGRRSFAQVQGAARNAEVVQSMGMTTGITARWTRIHHALLTCDEQVAERGAAILAASKMSRLLVQLSILGSGTVLVLGHHITPGVMIAGSIIMARALSPVEQAIGSWKGLSSARAAHQRLAAMFAEEQQAPETMELPAPEGHLCAEDVVFAFPGAAEPTIKAVSFACQPGDGIAIVGPSASGKSTLVRLLLGLLQPRRGNVRLDGADVSQWDREALGRHIGYLPQDVELFSGTIKENIARMSEPDADLVLAAAKMAGVHQMILRLPQGYETEIGENGVGLSGGQRQLIGLARALYGTPKLVVLDEPNANLDVVGEQMLARAIVNLRRTGSTVVIVSHRPGILRAVNKVLVLRNGAVEMAGPTQDVMSRIREQEENGEEAAQPERQEQSTPLAAMTSVRPVSIQGGRA